MSGTALSSFSGIYSEKVGNKKVQSGKIYQRPAVGADDMSYKDMLSSFMEDDGKKSKNNGNNSRNSATNNAATSHVAARSTGNTLGLELLNAKVAPSYINTAKFLGSAQKLNENYTLDEDGNVVTSDSGEKVKGWIGINGEVDTSGEPQELNVKPSKTIPPQATKNVDFSNNLNAGIKVINKISVNGSPIQGNTVTASVENPVTIELSNGETQTVTNGTYGIGQSMPITMAIPMYDSVGNSHSVPVYAVKTNSNSMGSEWTISLNQDMSQNTKTLYGEDGNNLTVQMDSVQLYFDTKGNYDTTRNNSATMTIMGNGIDKQEITLDFSKVTQYAGHTTISSTSDGTAAGKLKDVNVNEDGEIVSRYSNGISKIEGILLKDIRNGYGNGDEMINEQNNVNDIINQNVVDYKTEMIFYHNNYIAMTEREYDVKYVVKEDKLFIDRKDGNISPYFNEKPSIILGEGDEYIEHDMSETYINSLLKNIYDENYTVAKQEVNVSGKTHKITMNGSEPLLVFDSESGEKRLVAYIGAGDGTAEVKRTEYGEINIGYKEDYARRFTYVIGNETRITGTSVDIEGIWNMLTLKDLGVAIINGDENFVSIDEDAVKRTEIKLHGKDCTIINNSKGLYNHLLLPEDISNYTFTIDGGFIRVKNKYSDWEATVGGNYKERLHVEGLNSSYGRLGDLVTYTKVQEGGNEIITVNNNNDIINDNDLEIVVPADYEDIINKARISPNGTVPLNPWFNPEQWKDPRGYIEAKKAQHKIEVFNAGKTFFTDVDSVEETKKGLQGLVPLLEAISKTTSKVTDDKDVDIFNDLNQILGDLTRLADIYGRDISEEEKRKEIGKVAANISQSSIGMLNNVLKKWNEDEFLQDKPKFIGNPAVTGGLSILSSTIGLASSLAVACDGWDDKTAKEKASDYVNVLNNAFDLALDGIQTVEKTKEAYQLSHGLLNVASQEIKMGVWTPLDIWTSIGKGAIEGLVQFSESYTELKNDDGHLDTRDWGVTGIQTSMAGFKGILGSLTFGLDELVFGEDYEKKAAEHIINTSESIGTALGVTIVYGKDVMELASMIKNNLITVFTNNI